MKIVSDDSKILEKVYADLTNKSFDIEIIEKIPEKGAQVTGVEIAGLIFGGVPFIVTIVQYLENLEKEGKFVFFEKDKVRKMTLTDLLKLSQNEQRKIVDENTIIIEK